MLTDAVNSAADAELKLKLKTDTEEGKAEAGAEVEAHPTSQAKQSRPTSQPFILTVLSF